MLASRIIINVTPVYNAQQSIIYTCIVIRHMVYRCVYTRVCMLHCITRTNQCTHYIQYQPTNPLSWVLQRNLTKYKESNDFKERIYTVHCTMYTVQCTLYTIYPLTNMYISRCVCAKYRMTILPLSGDVVCRFKSSSYYRPQKSHVVWSENLFYCQSYTLSNHGS